jgi:hypothetical protein
VLDWRCDGILDENCPSWTRKSGSKHSGLVLEKSREKLPPARFLPIHADSAHANSASRDVSDLYMRFLSIQSGFETLSPFRGLVSSRWTKLHTDWIGPRLEAMGIVLN